jgi:hypothetical protein
VLEQTVCGVRVRKSRTRGRAQVSEAMAIQNEPLGLRKFII